MEKESAKELGGSDGIGLRSSKSEDDVFSDAVMEFPESGVSPSIEERLENVGEPDKNVGEELACDPNGSRLSKGNETAGKQLMRLAISILCLNGVSFLGITTCCAACHD